MDKNNHNLIKRSKIIQNIRAYFENHNYLEVETPYRIPSPAPESHINAPASEDWFLHTSPELSMKQLLADGYSKLFQICRCFRSSERSERHLPEFTLLEWYRSGADYYDFMEECEDMILYLSKALGMGDKITYQGQEINLRKSWEKISVKEAFTSYASVSLEKAIDDNLFDECIAFEIEPHLGKEKPVFLYDYPASLGALARLKQSDPSVAERFELYISGLELANAFSELTDPDEQRKRFEIEINYRLNTGKQVYPMPEKFLKSLSYMPESAGIALGIDRLVMIFTDSKRIDDVVAFVPEDL
ncbi:elongation factor P--(R)-beta-lysine ligase [Candidatus Magnetomoraceae bacterium gMMP-1]